MAGILEKFFLERSALIEYWRSYHSPEYLCYFQPLICSAVFSLDTGLQLACSFVFWFSENYRGSHLCPQATT